MWQRSRRGRRMRKRVRMCGRRLRDEREGVGDFGGAMLMGDSKPRWRIRTVLRDIGGMWLRVMWKWFKRFWMTTLVCDCKL